MRDRIRQILKEEIEKVSISDILPTLKKIYPQLDYCVSEDGNRLKIALIGPGIMEIPPQKWGAVEMMIWDYTQIIKSLGHRV